MAEEVTLPQLGESVTEGIITSWLVEVGDTVEVDQPLVEISTDKVDTEIPSPVAGTVTELRGGVDDTIEVGQVIALVGEGEAAPSDDSSADEEAAEEAEEAATAAATPEGTEEAAEQRADAPAEATSPGKQAPRPAAIAPQGNGKSGDAGSKALLSPLVRKLLREAGLGADQVRGSGQGGRITREDAERAIAAGGEQARSTTGAAAQPSASPPPPPSAPAARERPEASPTQIDFGGERTVTQDLTRVRKAIAKGMMDSLQSTAQLTAAVEADLTAIMNLRAATKDAFKARHGASLSPLPFVARALAMTVPRHPSLNASIDTDSGTATYHNFINLGMAVDTDRGLLVPNLKDAQNLTVPGLATGIADLARRTRDKQIQPDEIAGATITITNTGSRGTLFDTPILNPPQVAILAACAIEKRPVVVSDAYGDSIAIRWMTYLCLTYDHRMIDGADAARFLQDLKFVLETHDFRGELGV